MKPQYVAAMLAVVAAIMGVLWWTTNPAADETVKPPPAATPPERTPLVSGAASTSPRPAPPEAPEVLPPAMSADAGKPLWERQIDQVLETNADETQMVKLLINLLPTFPSEGQVEAVHHIANLIDDNEFKNAMPILLNPRMSEEVLSVLFTDLMNRSDKLKLRAFVEVAKVPGHPFQQEAMSDLEIYLDQNHGTDFGKWSAAVEKFLRDHPEDEANP